MALHELSPGNQETIIMGHHKHRTTAQAAGYAIAGKKVHQAKHLATVGAIQADKSADSVPV